MTYDKLAALSNIIQQKNNIKTIVEVGSYCGRSAVCIADTVDPSVDIYCIDHYYENRYASGLYADGKDGRPLSGSYMNQFEEFVKHTKDYKNINMMQGHCPYNIQWNGTDIDILFLDSDHQNPEDTDILTHFCKCMPAGGLIIGDDYLVEYAHGNNVIENVKLLESVYNTNAEFFGERKDLWVISVTKDYINLKDYI